LIEQSLQSTSSLKDASPSTSTDGLLSAHSRKDSLLYVWYSN